MPHFTIFIQIISITGPKVKIKIYSSIVYRTTKKRLKYLVLRSGVRYEEPFGF